mmetsp:Transcript_95265/g.274391  ORF Transcript_95265/g.274391 Transcript_95265/m.274391 type:complete len:270 (-) Transcript_95265:1018-1827(-)
MDQPSRELLACLERDALGEHLHRVLRLANTRGASQDVELTGEARASRPLRRIPHGGEALLRAVVQRALPAEDELRQLGDALVAALAHGLRNRGLVLQSEFLLRLHIAVVADRDDAAPGARGEARRPRDRTLAFDLALDELTLDSSPRRPARRPRAVVGTLAGRRGDGRRTGRRGRSQLGLDRPQPDAPWWGLGSGLRRQFGLDLDQIGVGRELVLECPEQVVMASQDTHAVLHIDVAGVARERHHELVVLVNLAPFGKPGLHGGKERGG